MNDSRDIDNFTSLLRLFLFTNERILEFSRQNSTLKLQILFRLILIQEIQIRHFEVILQDYEWKKFETFQTISSSKGYKSLKICLKSDNFEI